MKNVNKQINKKNFLKRCESDDRLEIYRKQNIEGSFDILINKLQKIKDLSVKTESRSLTPRKTEKPITFASVKFTTYQKLIIYVMKR